MQSSRCCCRSSSRLCTWRSGSSGASASRRSIATGHDVFTTIAFLKLMHLEISLTVVAAILTVIGYSLNDTIIIFDRVRENLRKGRKETLYETLNRSINETLPRSILTHATTFAATLALLFFAGEVIRPFAWVMAFGIFTGTFSSIYIASPVLLWIERKWPRRTAACPDFIDSHAHLADAAFAGDRDEVIGRARERGRPRDRLHRLRERRRRCPRAARAPQRRGRVSRASFSLTAGVHPHDAAGLRCDARHRRSCASLSPTALSRSASAVSTITTTILPGASSGAHSPSSSRLPRSWSARWSCTRGTQRTTRAR